MLKRLKIIHLSLTISGVQGVEYTRLPILPLRLYRSVYSNYEFIHYSHIILLCEISILDTFIFNSIFIRAVDILFTNKTLELFCEIVHESSFRA